MKRYRVLKYELDSRAAWLAFEIKDSWERNVSRTCNNFAKKIKEDLARWAG